ncbi:MAG: hypothetical protein INH41_12470 [Myxococcaceae bacterium]|nr:hypothetical protein [Myxococcaceae bacterium]MCA3013201.1 hypothetical protein [Myxococcaceae bacterium]
MARRPPPSPLLVTALALTAGVQCALPPSEASALAPLDGSSSAGRPPVSPGAPLDLTNTTRLFGINPVAADRASPPRPPLQARLLGTLTSRGPGGSLAALELPSGRVVTVPEGAPVLDATFDSVSRRANVVLRQGVLEPFTTDAARLPDTPAPPARPGDLTLTRAELRARIDDLPGLARSVHVLPAFRDGRAIGFRFVTLASRAPLVTLGLRAGDVVRAVNGQPLDSLNRVMGLASLLDTARTFVVELERDGQPLTLQHRLD